MGIVRWYHGKVRDGLNFEGVPKQTVQRHFDAFRTLGYLGFLTSDEGWDLNLLFEDNPSKKMEYLNYLCSRSNRFLPNVARRIVEGLADLIS